MNYKIIYGSLPYDPSITEEIFNHLIECARAQGLKFNKHFSDGGETYDHFKKLGFLNLDPTGEKYGKKCYVMDNNDQSMRQITLDSLKVLGAIINNYSIY